MDCLHILLSVRSSWEILQSRGIFTTQRFTQVFMSSFYFTLVSRIFFYRIPRHLVKFAPLPPLVCNPKEEYFQHCQIDTIVNLGPQNRRRNIATLELSYCLWIDFYSHFADSALGFILNSEVNELNFVATTEFEYFISQDLHCTYWLS